MRKPIAPYEIDWTHPLAKEMTLAVFDGKEYTNANYETVGLNDVVSPHGIGMDADGTAYNKVPESEGLRQAANFTWFSAYYKYGDAGSHAVLFGRVANGGASPYINYNLDINHNSQLAGRVGAYYDGTFRIINVTGLGLGYNTLCGVGDGSGFSAYSNAVYQDVYTGTVGEYTTGDNDVYIGTSGPSGDRDTASTILFCGVWQRTLSVDEIQSLHDNPYQILKTKVSLRDNVYAAMFPAAAGSSPWDNTRLGSSTPSAIYLGTDLITSFELATAVMPTTTSLTRNDITWSFSTVVEYGQFVTGDYYIIDPGAGVTISSVSPAPSANKNGTMLNPVSQAGQGLNVDAQDWDAALYESFPLAVSGGDAVVSSTAITTETENWAGFTFASAGGLEVKAAEILTVLSSHPATGTFRPCPCDRSQNLFNTSTINLNVLPEKSLTGITSPSHSGFGTVEYFERGMARPWLLFGADWLARSIHPIDNMYDYHTDVGVFLAEAATLICSDIASKDTLINNYIQVGIDYRYSGNADVCEWAWPVVFAGLLLDNSDMYDFWIDNPSIRSARDQEKTYYAEDRTPSRSSSIIATNETFTDWTNAAGKHVAWSKKAGQEYEQLHPSEWTCYNDDCKNEDYRNHQDVYPYIGHCLASILVDGEVVADVNAMLGHDPIKDYCDRWMSNIYLTGTYAASGKTYFNEMVDESGYNNGGWNTYGSGGTAFINDMWSAYR